SWSPVRISRTMAMCRWPEATRAAVAVAETRPVAVRTSAVMPRRWSAVPTGPVDRSTASRQRPSNIELLVLRHPPGEGARETDTKVYHPDPGQRLNSGWTSGPVRGSVSPDLGPWEPLGRTAAAALFAAAPFPW